MNTLEEHWLDFFKGAVKPGGCKPDTDEYKMFKAVFFAGCSAALNACANIKNSGVDQATGTKMIGGLFAEVRNNQHEVILEGVDGAIN